MNQITKVKHSLAHHTSVRWLLADWSELVDVSGCQFNSEEFELNKSHVTCCFKLLFTDNGAARLIFVVGPRPQSTSLYLSLAMLDCDMKKEVLVCDESISLPPDEDTVFLRFHHDEDVEVAGYGDRDAISILCEIYEKDDKDEKKPDVKVKEEEEEDEGYVREHCVEGGGEARVLDDPMSHDGSDDTYNTDDTDDDKPYVDRLVLMDYDLLYRTQDLCDLTMVAAGKAFMCHSFVLASLSSSMARLIRQTRACYSLQRHIDLSNETWLSAPLFGAFLEYAYGAQSILELRELVFELLLLAIKFHVRKLKLDCETFLRDNMDKFNVTRILCLAHQYGCKFLKAMAIDFAKTCLDDLRFFGELETLRNDPQLYLEVVGDAELYSIIV